MPALNPPKPVLEIARRLEDAGYEAWCVGGAVRDALLGHPHLDWDLATSARPDEVREIFGRRRTIPVGVEFGTVGVLDDAGTLHEVTTFRRDVKTDGRHAEVEFGASLDEDLARRDFTINAIAYSPATRELRDPFGGQQDLDRRVVRAVGDPDARMREDRLRALRAIRFSARFEFDIDAATLEAIARSAPHMGRLSAERVKQELEKTLEQVKRPSRAFALWKSSGILRTVIPPLADISGSTLAALDHVALPTNDVTSFRLLIRTAILFIDLGEAGARTALLALRFSNAESRRIAQLAREWSEVGARVVESIANGGTPGEPQVRRWVAAIGRLDLGVFMRIVAARAEVEYANEGEMLGARLRSLYRMMRRIATRDPIAVADLAVDGDDLRMAGIRQGPSIGKILKALLDAVLADPTRNRRDWLLQEAQRLAAGETGP